MKVHPDLLIYRYKTLITVTFLVSAYLTIHHLRDFDNWFRGRQAKGSCLANFSIFTFLTRLDHTLLKNLVKIQDFGILGEICHAKKGCLVKFRDFEILTRPFSVECNMNTMIYYTL
ncbi:MAG TPA: hypothetical protein DEP00_01745 [Lachnospiraceae bacterium]|nr:hypothetical protein [Lachnospiraceae bacterium]